MKDSNGKHQCDRFCGMACPKYAASWLSETQQTYSPRFAQQQIQAAAMRQAANVAPAARYCESVLADNGLTVEDYRQSVTLLQAAALAFVAQ
jgi:hypothetical protein